MIKVEIRLELSYTEDDIKRIAATHLGVPDGEFAVSIPRKLKKR